MTPDRDWVPESLRDLPEGWSWSAIQEVAEVDPRVRRPESGSVVPVVTMSAVAASTGRIEAPEAMSIDTVGKHLRGFAVGDVLLAKISPSFENGKVAVTEGLDGDVGFGSTEFHVLRAGPRIAADYLWLVLRQQRLRAHLVPGMTGRANQQRISRSALEELAIPVPPTRAEQHEIVGRVLSADEPWRAALEHIARSKAEVENLRMAVISDVTFSGSPWEWQTLADMVAADRQIRYGIVQPGAEYPDGVPYVRVRDFSRGSIKRDALGHTDPAIAERHRAAMLHAGDLLVSIRGTIGEVARVPPELDGAQTTQDAARISPPDALSGDWLTLVIRSERTQRWLRDNTSGRAVQGVSVTALRGMPVPVPPRQEMQRRVRLGDRSLAELDKADAALERALVLARRAQEAQALGLLLGRRDPIRIALLPTPRSIPETTQPDRPAAGVAPVTVPDEAPRIVHAVAQLGGRVDATALLARQGKLDRSDFYDELWTAVIEGWLRKPAEGSSLVELVDAP